MSLPNELKQVFFALLAGIVVVVSGLVPGVASASAATVAPVEGSGHIVITYACDGKIGLYIQGFNDVEGSDPISFVLTDNITNEVVANVTDVPYGTYRTSGIGLQFGDSYDITATGSGGYSELFQGTFVCESSPVTVTATPPTFTDVVGTADVTYVVPSTVGVEYLVDGVVTTADTYPGTGTVTITARAKSGYVLEGTTTWTYTYTATPKPLWASNLVVTQPSCETVRLSFDYSHGPGDWYVMRDQVRIASGSVSTATGSVSDIVVTGQPAGTYDIALVSPYDPKALDETTITIGACVTPPIVVTPKAPTFTDKAGSADDTYTVPSTVGVEYSVSDVVKAAGAYPGTGAVTVTAGAKSGYVLVGTAVWTHEFTDVVAPPTTTPSPAVTVAGAASAGSDGQTALNPGFGAKTGWGEDSSAQNGLALVAAVLLTMAAMTRVVFLRRRIGEQ